MKPKERAAMQQALEALVVAEEFVDRHSEDWYISGQQDLKQIREALTSLREALANTRSSIRSTSEYSEQEKPIHRKVLREMLDAHEQAEQEPVAEALRLSEEAIEYARQGGKVGSGIYGKALSAIRAAKETTFRS